MPLKGLCHRSQELAAWLTEEAATAAVQGMTVLAGGWVADGWWWYSLSETHGGLPW